MAMRTELDDIIASAKDIREDLSDLLDDVIEDKNILVVGAFMVGYGMTKYILSDKDIIMKALEIPGELTDTVSADVKL